MANIEVGSAFVSIYPKTDKLSSGITKALGGIKMDAIAGKMGGSFVSGFNGALSALTVAAGNLISGAVGTALDTALSGISSGIRRSDILRNFPKTMVALGYSAEEADASVQNMMDHLMGLPTATQDMAQFVQGLTASTGSLDKATKVGLAFNDMLLAAGADTGTATNAQLVFNRMLGSGTYNAMRWQSISAAMPGQLKQLAERLLGAGNTAVQLGEALSNGTVSFDDLMDAMIEMDQVSTDTFTNFEEQARSATGGIGTALTNMSTRIGAGWQYVIDKFGNENIASVITAFGNGIRDSIKVFGDFLNRYISADDIAKFAENVTKGFADALKGVKEFVSSPLFVQVSNLFFNLLHSVGEFADGVDKALGAGYVGQVFSNLGKNIQDFARNANLVISKIDFTAIGEKVGRVVDTVVEAFGRIVEIFNNAFLSKIDFGAISTAFESIKVALQGVWEWAQPVLDAFAEMAGSVLGETLNFIAGVVQGLVGYFQNMGERAAFAADGTYEMQTPVQVLQDNLKMLFDRINKVVEALAPFGAAVGEFLGKAIEAAIVVISDIIGYIVQLIDAVMNLPQAWADFKQKVSDIMDKIKSAIVDTWNNIKKSITDALGNVKTSVNNGFNTVKTNISNIWNGIKSFFSTVWSGIKTIVSTAVNAVQTTVSNVFNAVKTVISTVWNAIKQVITTVWGGIKTAVSTAVNAVKTTVSNVFNAVKTVISTVWNAIKQVIMSVWSGITSAVSTAVNTVKNTVSNVFTAVSTTVSTVWNGIKTTISNVVNGIKTTVSSVFNGISTTISNILGGIRGTVSSIWNGIKNTISNAINGARNAVSTAINAIKGLFNFRISWPHIPLPHFWVSGSPNPLDWLTQGVPSFGIQWYAKGGFVDGATLIGAGEAGAEMILPRRGGLMNEFADAVTSRVDNTADAQMVIAWLSKNLPNIIENYTPVLSGKDFQRQVRSAAVWSD